MAENGKIVMRCMADYEFQGATLPGLAKEIFEAIRRMSRIYGINQRELSEKMLFQVVEIEYKTFHLDG